MQFWIPIDRGEQRWWQKGREEEHCGSSVEYQRSDVGRIYDVFPLRLFLLVGWRFFLSHDLWWYGANVWLWYLEPKNLQESTGHRSIDKDPPALLLRFLLPTDVHHPPRGIPSIRQIWRLAIPFCRRNVSVPMCACSIRMHGPLQTHISGWFGQIRRIDGSPWLRCGLFGRPHFVVGDPCPPQPEFRLSQWHGVDIRHVPRVRGIVPTALHVPAAVVRCGRTPHGTFCVCSWIRPHHGIALLGIQLPRACRLFRLATSRIPGRLFAGCPTYHDVGLFLLLLYGHEERHAAGASISRSSWNRLKSTNQ